MGAGLDSGGNRGDITSDRFRLPVSGWYVTVQSPTGLEDLLLRESRASDFALALELFGRLVHVEGGSSASFGQLPATDGEALLLLLRRAALGDLVRAEARCTATQCTARVDVDFRIGEYLAAQKIGKPKILQESEKQGWFSVDDQSAQFRLPTCADLVAIDVESVPYSALIRRCIEPAGISGRLRKRVEDAMAVMAPRFSRSLTGRCPECNQAFDFYFDVHSFVLRELRNHAASVYLDVHLLALHYKWPERLILEMPRNRRTQYVEMLRDMGVAA
jgi:hypothetical protein